MLARMWAKDATCPLCDSETIMQSGEKCAPNRAVLVHKRTRLDGRSPFGEVGSFLACKACADKINRERMANIPLETRRELAGRRSSHDTEPED